MMVILMKKDIETLEDTNSTIEILEPHLSKKNNNSKIVILVIILVSLLTFVGMRSIFKEEEQDIPKEEINNNNDSDNNGDSNILNDEDTDDKEYDYKFYRCSTDSKENYYNNIKYNYYETYSFLVNNNDNKITSSTVKAYVTFNNEFDYNNFKKDNSMYEEDENGVLSLVYDTKFSLFSNDVLFDDNFISLVNSRNYICDEPERVIKNERYNEEKLLERLLK